MRAGNLIVTGFFIKVFKLFFLATGIILITIK